MLAQAPPATPPEARTRRRRARPSSGCGNARRHAWRNCRSEAQPRHAVDAISHHRQPDRGQVDADLVRAARLEPNAQQCVLGQQSAPPRSASRRRAAWRCPATAASDRWRSRPMGASIRPRRERGRPRTSARYSRSSARRRTRPCSRLKASSLRATTSSPDVSRSRRWTMPARSAGPPVARVPRSAPASVPRVVPGPGMDDDTGRLVDDQQVLVLPGDAQVRRLGLVARLGRGLGAARSESPRRRPGGGSSAGRLRRRAPLRRRRAARRPRGSPRRRLLGEIPVESQARGRLRYAQRDQERSVEAPCRRRGLRSPASIVPSSSTTPTTMQTSARLNAGQ